MPAKRENFVRLLYVTLLVQFFVIAILFGALSNEYISNAYMQAWIGRNVPCWASYCTVKWIHYLSEWQWSSQSSSFDAERK